MAQVHVEGASTPLRHHSEILWIRFSLRAGDDVVPKGCEIPGPQRGRAQRKPEGDTVPGETVPGSVAERRRASLEFIPKAYCLNPSKP